MLYLSRMCMVEIGVGVAQVETFGEGKLHTVNGIYTRNAVNEIKKSGYRFLFGVYSLCWRLREKKNKCVHPRHLSLNERSDTVQQRGALLRYASCERPEAIAACSSTGRMSLTPRLDLQ